MVKTPYKINTKREEAGKMPHAKVSLP